MERLPLEQEAAAILDQLDRRSTDSGANGRRSFPRHPYRTQAEMLRRHEDGSFSSEWIHTRDLSVEGLGCLHVQDVPKGTSVRVLLKSMAGTNPIGGAVAHCQPLQGDLYLVGLRLEQRINPEDYLGV